MGCQEELEAISQITKFRIMAVQTEPPEARPGESVTMRALWADPKGEGREVTFFWLTCLGDLNPTDNLQEGCQVLNTKIATDSEGGNVFEIEKIPPNALDGKQEDQDFITATTIVAMCAGGKLPSLEDIISSGEVSRFDELCQGGDGLVSIKRFRISEREPDDRYRNKNPSIVSISFDYKPLLDAEFETPGKYTCQNSAGCVEGVELEAFLSQPEGNHCAQCEPCRDDGLDGCSTCEDGDYQHWPENRFDEESCAFDDPYISWFATGGEFSSDRSRPGSPARGGPIRTKWHPPRYGGKFQLWAAAHDLRGGVSWREFLIEAVHEPKESD
jgi:hypothetical protein